MTWVSLYILIREKRVAYLVLRLQAHLKGKSEGIGLGKEYLRSYEVASHGVVLGLVVENL